MHHLWAHTLSPASVGGGEEQGHPTGRGEGREPTGSLGHFPGRSSFQGACCPGVRTQTQNMRENSRPLQRQPRRGMQATHPGASPCCRQDSCATVQTSCCTLHCVLIIRTNRPPRSGRAGAGPELAGACLGAGGRVWVTHLGSGPQPATRHPPTKAKDDTNYKSEMRGCVIKDSETGGGPGLGGIRAAGSGPHPHPEAWPCSSGCSSEGHLGQKRAGLRLASRKHSARDVSSYGRL